MGFFYDNTVNKTCGDIRLLVAMSGKGMFPAHNLQLNKLLINVDKYSIRGYKGI